MGLAQHITSKAIIVVILTLAALSCAITALVFSIQLHGAVEDLRSNHEGDPEREYVDDCMRDFKHLPPDDGRKLEQKRKCIEALGAEPRFKWLPKIRLTVDERVCDPETLCAPGDPGPCKDSGDPRGKDYQVGNVTACFNLIDKVRQDGGKTATERAELDAEVQRRCTREDRWKDYENAVKLDYCMWKHYSVGVCTNNLRSQCDDSCCPHKPLVDETDLRNDEYQCRKSPVVGLFCQHLESTERAWTKNKAAPYELCTAVTCPNFSWCRAFTDVPGLCLGQACLDYARLRGICITCIVICSLGLLLDVADLIVFWKFANAVVAKSIINFLSSGVKLLGFCLIIAGGGQEFLSTIVEKQCFIENGQEMTQVARDVIDSYLLAAILSSLTSLALAPLSMYWGGKIIGVPYTLLRS
jgi:hypothetical protein